MVPREPACQLLRDSKCQELWKSTINSNRSVIVNATVIWNRSLRGIHLVNH
jgi:hypothetical protein